MSEESSIISRYENLLFDNILKFWEPRIIDTEHGGFNNCFDRKGSLKENCKAGWFLGRNIYIFSKLIENYGNRDNWESIVTEGIRTSFSLIDKNGFLPYFYDDNLNAVHEHDNQFTEAFLAQGLIAAYKVKLYSDSDYLTKLVKKVVDNLSSRDYLSEFSLSSEVLNLPVSFMRLMVAQDACSAGFNYSKVVKEEAEKICFSFYDTRKRFHAVTYNLVDGHYSSFMNPGHSAEALGFVIRDLNLDASLRVKAADIFKEVIKKGKDRLYGGYFLNIIESEREDAEGFREDWLGDEVLWSDKVWWVQLEFLSTLLESYLLTRDAFFLNEFYDLDSYLMTNFCDKDYLEIYGFLDRKNNVKDYDKGSLLKGPYHVIRTLINSIESLNKIKKTKSEEM